MGLMATIQEVIPESSQDSQPSRKRSRKIISPIWSYFEKLDKDAFARCLVCGSKYQKSNNTSNLAKVIYDTKVINYAL